MRSKLGYGQCALHPCVLGNREEIECDAESSNTHAQGANQDVDHAQLWKQQAYNNQSTHHCKNSQFALVPVGNLLEE